MGTRIALVLAIVLGFVSALGVRMWMLEQKGQMVEKYQPREILVTSKRLRKGEQLKPDAMQGAFVQQPYIVQGMVPFADRMRFINKVIDRDLSPGSPVFEEFLSEPAQAVTQTRQIVAEGKRAVVLNVDQVSGMAGMLRAGDYVDVVGTFEVGDEPVAAPAAGGAAVAAVRSGTGVRRTRTLYMLQAARVIALDNRALGDSVRENARTSSYRTVTLEVMPEDVMRLINAQSQGNLQLILRNRSDVALTDGTDAKTNRPTTHWDVLGEVRKTEPRQ